MNVWLVLVHSVNRNVFESFEIRVRGVLESTYIVPVDLEPAVEWVEQGRHSIERRRHPEQWRVVQRGTQGGRRTDGSPLF